jgi:hypothetical protein
LEASPIRPWGIPCGNVMTDPLVQTIIVHGSDGCHEATQNSTLHLTKPKHLRGDR